jgi:ubiquitin C-terminal hydrolase
MIDDVEVSPSNLAECVRCYNKIKKLEIRGIRFSQFICEKCLKKELNGIDKEIKELKNKTGDLLNLNKEAREFKLLKRKVLKNLE